MKKEEKSFQQLVKEVIDQARTEAGRRNNNSLQANKRIDTSANIADEWRLPPNQHGQFPINK
jgi:hypothetical protein